MKKLITLSISILFTLGLATTAFSQNITSENSVSVTDTNLNNALVRTVTVENLTNNDTITLDNCYNIDGVTYVSDYDLLDAFGVVNSLGYNYDDIYFSNDLYDVTFILNSNDFYVNELKFNTQNAPILINGTRYLPLRAVANSLGYVVGYDNLTKQITITSTDNLDIIRSYDDLAQFSKPSVHETIATINTNMGDITLRLFPEYAPLAVENFKELATSDYYDDVTFHRVINDFVIQGGDPTGTGAGGESYFGDDFVNEVTNHLAHFDGALAMANSGVDTNGSQFYIVENNQLSDTEKLLMNYFISHPFEQSLKDGVLNCEIISPFTASKYLEVGGTPYLDGGYTVFGQVVEGMDVVRNIAEVETTENDKPINDVVINNISIKETK